MRSRSRDLVAFVGGFFLALVLFASSPVFISEKYNDISGFRRARQASSYELPHSHSHEPNSNQTANTSPTNDEHDVKGKEPMDLLWNKVRIFCWIMTSPANTWKKAIHVNATWAQRCNKFVFVTPDEISGLPSLETGIEEKRKNLWGKTKRAFKHIYNHELNNYDWFLKADDDTYVIVDNLRFMLLAYSRDAPVYFGCRFNKFVRQGYMSGGSGYVLSREALRRFGKLGLMGPMLCRTADVGTEDVLIGECLEKIGVQAADSRDAKTRHRMLPFSPTVHFDATFKIPRWFSQYMYYPYEQGDNCCSNYLISLHYVTRGDLYTIHYLLYRVRVFGHITPAERLLARTVDILSDAKLIELMKEMSTEEMPLSEHRLLEEINGKHLETNTILLN